jgi:hypothetical protein
MKNSNLSFLLVCVCLIISASPKIVNAHFSMITLLNSKETYFLLSDYYTSGLGGNVTVNFQL